MQQNLNKCKKIINYMAWMATALFVVSTFVFPNRQNIASNIVSICSIGWIVFDKVLWKVKWINRLLEKLSNIWGTLSSPVLAGRWEGYFIRYDGTENPRKHPFVLEVTQTFTSISCKTFSKRSTSESELAEIILTNQGTHKLNFLWTSKPVNGPKEYIPFEGYSILELSLTNPYVLSGYYFTNREPQTKGEVWVKWKSRKIKNHFGQCPKEFFKK